MATVTIRLIELELSAGAYDGSRVELSSGAAGYVETNLANTTVTIAEALHLEAADPNDDYKKRLLYYIYGDPTPGAYIVGKEVR